MLFYTHMEAFHLNSLTPLEGESHGYMELSVPALPRYYKVHQLQLHKIQLNTYRCNVKSSHVFCIPFFLLITSSSFWNTSIF